MKYFEVAVNTPFNKSILTYSSNMNLRRGDLVQVPLGKRNEKGCVLHEVSQYDDPEKLKEILKKAEGVEELEIRHLNLLEWVAKYYHYPVGQHIFDTLPKLLKRPRPYVPLVGLDNDFDYELTSEQSYVCKEILNSVKGFRRILLHGVTGSGKTTVYLTLFKSILESGKNCFFLIPEINLTPQFIKIFEKYLSGKIYTYHSSMSNSEKLAVWKKVKNTDEPYILIGVRSSVFLPFSNLGVIVVDEEHDQSYKQEDRCPYHGRDVATKIASGFDCPIILGSATPTVETLSAIRGTKDYFVLKNRPKSLMMPVMDICDTRSGKEDYDEETWPFNKKTLERIKGKLQDNEQVLIFVNRLGFATFVQCRSCGHEFHCPNCTTSLKYFKSKNKMKCQYCDYSITYPEGCPTCGNMKLAQKGFGTEKILEVIRKQFPTFKSERFDRDAIKNFSDLKDILNQFQKREIDLLVGTQMLSKGHDFSGVNLVVLLGVDGQLNFPDFRSNEKVFQLITQTAGRPGRSQKQGEVIIETLSPKNKIFEYITKYDQKSFYNEELSIRKELNLPPFSRICSIYFSSGKNNFVVSESNKAVELLKSLGRKHFQKVEILGPRPALIEKRANKYTWSVFIKSEDLGELHSLVDNFQKYFKPHYSLSFKIDIDPISIM